MRDASINIKSHVATKHIGRHDEMNNLSNVRTQTWQANCPKYATTMTTYYTKHLITSHVHRSVGNFRNVEPHQQTRDQRERH